jgi:hypothetical protein
MCIKRPIIAVIILTFTFVCTQAQVAVGKWKTYFNYSAGCDVDRIDNDLYYASQSSIVRINLNDNSIHHIGKVEGLSDVGIQCLRANQTTKTVIICYRNSNIDLYQNGKVSNIPDLYNKQITGDKTIYTILVHDKYAYLACGFGVLVLDVKKKSIVDTWFFRQNNQNYPVKDLFLTKDSTIYAATDHALFKNNIANSNIKDFATWERVTNINTPNNDAFLQLASLNDDLYLMKTDTQTVLVSGTPVFLSENVIYSFKNNLWEKDTSFNFNEYDTNYQYLFIRSSFDKLIVGTNTGVKCYSIHPTTQTIDSDLPYHRCTNPVTAVCGNADKLYIVSGDGISEGRSDGLHFYDVRGPAPGAVSAMTWKNDKLLVAHTIMKAWVPNWVGGYLSALEKGWWSVIPGQGAYDLIGVAIAPYDKSVVLATSFVMGVYEYKDYSLVQHFNMSNSSLDTMGGGTIRTSSPVFDKNNNLWLGNWGVSRPLVVRMADGTWKSFSIPGGIQYLERIFIDSRNILWLMCERETKLMLFNPVGTISNASWAQLNLLLPEDKGPFNHVYSVAEDKDGKIWLGTDKGIKVYYNPSQLFSNPNILPEPVYVTKDSLTELVLSAEVARCIKVDAANRKWIGTDNAGVFLLSADGKEELFHFTMDNSPLLSDVILSIEIDGVSGEVYFGTDRGLISFRYTATDGKEKYEELKIFPNPVREDFDGYISISGLKEKSEVKITDAHGGLVYRTASDGGTAVWDGKRFNGEKAATGVYFVFVNDETGKERKAGKILFIK